MKYRANLSRRTYCQNSFCLVVRGQGEKEGLRRREEVGGKGEMTKTLYAHMNRRNFLKDTAARERKKELTARHLTL
jgi:hypothetical protein